MKTKRRKNLTKEKQQQFSSYRMKKDHLETSNHHTSSKQRRNSTTTSNAITFNLSTTSWTLFQESLSTLASSSQTSTRNFLSHSFPFNIASSMNSAQDLHFNSTHRKYSLEPRRPRFTFKMDLHHLQKTYYKRNALLLSTANPFEKDISSCIDTEIVSNSIYICHRSTPKENQ